jgi:hypothetical protein
MPSVVVVDVGRLTVIVSPRSTPTWMSEAGRRAVEQVHAVEGGLARDAVDSPTQLPGTRCPACAVGRGQRAVGRLDRELAHAGEDVAHFLQRAFRGLREADAVLRVAAGDRVGADLRAHALGNAEARRVVGRSGDAQTGRQAREVALQSAGDGSEVALRGHRRDVRVDAKSHRSVPWIGNVLRN